MATEAASTKPIQRTTRISDLLRDHPALLEVLVAQSPAFGKLRNPVLRSVQARLVTVEQAAKIAGLAADDLVRILNAAAGLEPAEPVAEPVDEHGEPDADAAAKAPVAVELDAGAYIAQGIEPFNAIMEAVAKVPVGQALKLTNTFEPVPLYAVLGKRGFVHSARQLGPESWDIRFLNLGKPAAAPVAPGAPAAEPQPGTATTAATNAPTAEPESEMATPAATITIDVSDLVPPEPLVRIMEALEGLAPGQTLLVHHQRRPIHLYPVLDERGYRHVTTDLPDGRVELRITKPSAANVAEQA